MTKQGMATRGVLPEVVKGFLLRKLLKSENKMINQMNSFRAEVMGDAIVYIKDKLNSTMRLLTKHHHSIIE